MSENTGKNWQVRTGTPAQAVALDAKLARAQEANRLALHMFEDMNRTACFPQTILSQMEQNKAVFDISREREISKEELALISMSLIPSRASGKPSPFYTYSTDQPGYLFLLSEDQPPAPVVVRAMEKIYCTGYNNRDKTFFLFSNTVHPQLRSFYGAHMHSVACPEDDIGSAERLQDGKCLAQEQALLNAAMKDPKRFAGALDVIGRIYENTEYNGTSEILAGALPEHVAAIAMPRTQPKPGDLWERKNQDIQMMEGALCGLEHSAQGFGLPLVDYALDGTHAGRVRCLAYDEPSCRALAYKTIDRLQKNPEFVAKHAPWPEEQIQRLLGWIWPYRWQSND